MAARLLRLVVALAAGAFTAGVRASPAQDYTLYCMGCHGAQAQGVSGRIPPLAGSVSLFMRTPEGRDYVLRVPGAANSALPDAQLAAVLNWLADSYGASGVPRPVPFTVDEVTRVRRTPLVDVQARRREVVRALAATGPAPPTGY
ncbi:MAG TPA: cytochrome c [Steroidobacteraceae bacterium]|nr:cytochrome c [Steroidobacteraceae bacterium]